MIALRSVSSYVSRAPNVAGAIYGALVVAACLITFGALSNTLEQYRARNTSLEMLSRLEGRSQLKRGGTNIPPPGSPFLDGQTATTASAALLQRLANIITNAGGIVVSSEMLQQGSRSKDGYVTATANCELGQDDLQRVLYEIEAGTPFLFIDQLVVQTSAGPGESGKLRVTLGVTAQWAGAK